jgi:cytoskeletal protein CcmA (bactofilin family)
LNHAPDPSSFDLPAPVAASVVDEAAHTSAISVKAGNPLPPAKAQIVQLQAHQVVGSANSSGHTAIAAGMHFQGNAVVQSNCVIAGGFIGNLSQADASQVTVTVAESGQLKGDVKAHHIVVMGRTHGLLDASSGMVSLHETSHVQGHVRYSKLQVSGAELNATLEKASAPARNDR